MLKKYSSFAFLLIAGAAMAQPAPTLPSGLSAQPKSFPTASLLPEGAPSGAPSGLPSLPGLPKGFPAGLPSSSPSGLPGLITALSLSICF